MSEILEKALFWEKYRPTSLEEAILPDRIMKLAQNGIDGNYLLYGAPGMGKTTLARILLQDYPDGQHIVLDGKLGVEELRNIVTSFCSEMIAFADPNKLRVVYFEEFDKATRQLQDELKSFMEEHSHRVRFVATCNNVSKINDAIRSRFIEVDFTPVGEESKTLKNRYARRILEIVEKEELKVSKDDVIKIVKDRFPDFRKIWQDVQYLHKTGYNPSKKLVASENERLFELIINSKNSEYTWEYLYVNWMDKIDTAMTALGRDFFKYVLKKHPEKKNELGNTVITLVKYTDSYYPNCIDPFVTLVALVHELQKFYMPK